MSTIGTQHAGTTRPVSADCLSDLAMDSLVAGSQPESSYHAHLSACERCSARLDLFRSADKTATPTVEQLLAVAQRPQRTPRRQPSRWALPSRWMMIFSAAAFAVAVLVLVPTLRNDQSNGVLENLRIKGTNVRFFVRRGDDVVPGRSGERYRTGDALRFAVSSGVATYFFLVGVEEGGKVSAYHPFNGNQSARIEPGVDAPLPGSLVLDASPQTEYFLGVFTPEPLTFSDVEVSVRRARERHGSSLEALQKIDLPGEHHWIVVRKR